MTETTSPPSPGLDLDSNPVEIVPSVDNPTPAGNGSPPYLLKSLDTQPRALHDVALVFLSNASTGTLASLGIGLLVTIYLLLGRLSLFLIGLVSGVVLHASWEGFREDAGIDGLKSNGLQRRKELGVEVANRLMNWQGARAMKGSVEYGYITRSSEYGSTYFSFRPATGAALTDLTDAIIRNYVR